MIINEIPTEGLTNAETAAATLANLNAQMNNVVKRAEEDESLLNEKGKQLLQSINQKYVEKGGDAETSFMTHSTLSYGPSYTEEEAEDAWEDIEENAEEFADSQGAMIFKKPDLGDKTDNTEETIDGVMTDGEEFLNSAKEDIVNQENLQSFSNMLYNILLTIAVAAAVIVGGIIGIKLMTSSAEDKAEVKQFLLPYVIGCIVVFGGFGIWKLAVTILQTI